MQPHCNKVPSRSYSPYVVPIAFEHDRCRDTLLILNRDLSMTMSQARLDSEAPRPFFPAHAIRRKENQMKSVCARSSEKSSATVLVRLFAASLAILVIFSLASASAFAQCSLSSPDTWSLGANRNWSVAGNWSGGVPNGSSTNTCITDGSSTVALDINANVGDLQLASGNTLNFNGNTSLTVNGSQIINAGAININGGGGTNTYLYLPTAVTLSGGGTLSLNTPVAGGGNAYLWLENGVTLDNVNNTIQGEGIIYNNLTTVSNHAGGVINANSTGSALINTLTLEYGSVTNAGLMEATNSGTLYLYSTTVNNA